MRATLTYLFGQGVDARGKCQFSNSRTSGERCLSDEGERLRQFDLFQPGTSGKDTVVNAAQAGREWQMFDSAAGEERTLTQDFYPVTQHLFA